MSLKDFHGHKRAKNKTFYYGPGRKMNHGPGRAEQKIRGFTISNMNHLPVLGFLVESQPCVNKTGTILCLEYFPHTVSDI